MKVIIHSGEGEIGNSCLEIASATTRLIFDCGGPLERTAETEPPPVQGLFNSDAPPPNVLLLTHAHLDHTGFLPNLIQQLPICATTETSKVMKVRSMYARGVEIPRDRFREMPVPDRGGGPVKPQLIGDLEVTAFPVDHSAPGAVGYLVRHGAERIFYTGDLRFHGRKQGMARRITSGLAGKLDLLITEGTNVGRKQSGLPTEQDVERIATRHMRACTGLVLTAYSPQNLDRFVSFYRASEQAGRTFVCDPYQAAVLYQINRRSLPRAGPHLRICYPRRRSRVRTYENKFQSARIDLQEILSLPEKYTFLFRPRMLAEDFGGHLPPGSELLFGMWSGYQAKDEWQAVEATVPIVHCHSSGHAHAEDLFRFIGKLAPKHIPPVHTMSSAFFSQRFPQQTLTASYEH